MGTIISIIVVLCLVAAIAYISTVYNGLVRLKNNIGKAWANIDVLLKQRHDEIPKLVKVCEGHMQYEKQTLEKVIQARAAYLRANTVGQKAEANNMLSGALGHLFAVAENYPDLKASQGFVQLQQRVTALEENIADRREFYNESVNAFNIRIQEIPDVIIARLLNYTPQEMFKVAERDREDVDIAFNFPQ